MKFNIIMESGETYINCVVLTERGFATNKRDIHINMKYNKGITILNKNFMNLWLDSKFIYEIEEIEKKEIKGVEDEDDN